MNQTLESMQVVGKQDEDLVPRRQGLSIKLIFQEKRGLLSINLSGLFRQVHLDQSRGKFTQERGMRSSVFLQPPISIGRRLKLTFGAIPMGEAVRILDLARDLITLSGYLPEQEIPIKFTGLKPGEKTEERLTAPGEELVATRFEKLLVASQDAGPDPGLAQELKSLVEIAMKKDRAGVLKALVRLVPEFTPAEGGYWTS